ncbi:DNA translocase FtsK [bacterium]|nr:DNA translocase FtsK [bacterium]
MSKKGKKSKKTTPQKSNKKNRFGYSEIWGIILLLLGIFIFTSLISYHSADPSWVSTTTTSQKVHNYMGKVGASLSELFLQLLGFTSFFLSLGLIYLGSQAFFPSFNRRILKKTGGVFLLLLMLSILLSMFFHSLGWRNAEISAGGGGILGDLLSSVLIRYFNHTGTYLLIFSGLILFFLLYTHFSITQSLQKLSHLLNSMFKEVRIRIIHHQKSRQRKKMRKKVIQKYTPSKAEKKKNEPEAPPAKAPPSQPQEKEKYLFPEMEKRKDYNFPPLSLLDPGKPAEKIDKNELYEKKECIEEKLSEFNVEGEVKEYHPGPVLTTYEFYPQPGIKVSQVANLSEDLSLALGAESVRIQRIPGKSSLGMEVPNNKREIIKLRDVIQSDKFINSPSKLTFALGKTVHGEFYISDLSIMPHLLLAGATGTGKSVALNAFITSILYKASPEEVKLILIDPKRLEFSLYNGVPHLLSPVVQDPKKAGAILLDAIKKMENRYQKLGQMRVRNIEQYNREVAKLLKEQKGKLSEEEKEKLKPLPYLVIIIDELSELMMVGAQEVEYCIARLAQLARAVGIHLVMATQRPSIDVITGTVKNNFNSRISFRVPSKVDSRIIIDTGGAEKLLGNGDMLFMPPNYPRLIRLHCSYVSLPEVTRVVQFVKGQGQPIYDQKIVSVLEGSSAQVEEEEGERDDLFDKAVELVLLTGQASASYLQRKLKLGYARAARIIDQMEEEGILGPSEGSKPREIKVDPQTYLKKNNNQED